MGPSAAPPLLATFAVLDAAPFACFILAFVAASTPSSVDRVLIVLGAGSVVFGFLAAGLWTRNELVAAAVPATCALCALVGNMLPYELGVFGTSIEDRFRDNDTFQTWQNGYYLAFYFAYSALTYATFLGIGFGMRIIVYTLRWQFGEADALALH